MRSHCACLFVVNAGLLLVACETAFANEPAATPAKTLQFDGQTLTLAWEGGEPGSTIREFIPAGETLEKWTHLASIREYAAIDDPRALAAQTLKLTRDTYPQTPSNIIEDPTTGDTIIDFAAWPDDNSFLEFNVFKYSKRPGGGVVAQQYALRVYGDATEFAKNLPTIRERIVDEMARTGLQSQ
jgi:hypothetical protein